MSYNDKSTNYHLYRPSYPKAAVEKILKQDVFVVLLWNRFGGNPYDGEIGKLNMRLFSSDKAKGNGMSREVCA